MKIRLMTIIITVGLLVSLAGIGVAPAGAGIDDPRAARIAVAIAYAMSGQQDPSEDLPQVKNTDVIEALGGTVADTDFYPAGAFVQTFVIEKTQGHLSGLIYHRDGLSRVIMTRFTATFQEGDKLTITDVDLTPAYAPTPRTAMFFVPATGFNGLSFKAALLKANKLAIPAMGQKADSKPKTYTVVAFMMDRQPPGMQMELVQNQVSGSAEGALRKSGINEDGWCYAAFPATFAYNRGVEVFFNIFLRNGKASWLANTYSSHSLLKRTQRALAQRGYDPGPADGLMGAKTRQSLQRFQKQQGIAADGKPSLALLALLKATDNPPGIQLAQASLKTLGYDPGPVDGQLGQKTVTALKAYQTACRLPSDGVLNAEVLCQLADAAGLMPVGRSNTPTAGVKVNRYKSRMWPNQLAAP